MARDYSIVGRGRKSDDAQYSSSIIRIVIGSCARLGRVGVLAHRLTRAVGEYTHPTRARGLITIRIRPHGIFHIRKGRKVGPFDDAQGRQAQCCASIYLLGIFHSVCRQDWANWRSPALKRKRKLDGGRGGNDSEVDRSRGEWR